MRTVICISIREANPDQIKINQQYKIDFEQAYGDSDGDWFVPVYTMTGDRLGVMNLKHFRSL